MRQFWGVFNGDSDPVGRKSPDSLKPRAEITLDSISGTRPQTVDVCPLDSIVTVNTCYPRYSASL